MTDLPNASLYFEDFHVGQTWKSESHTFSEEEMLDFGRRYVPMPYHTDPEAARLSQFGSLIGPGHLTAAVAFGLFVRTGVMTETADGSPGMNVRWVRPVRPGDTIHVVAEITEVSPARRAGGKDAVRLVLTTYNQDGDVVLTHDTLQFVKRRGDRAG